MMVIKRLDIALTTSCNFHCGYCRGNPGLRKKIPVDEVTTIIDNFRELGLRTIRLDGGEPFLYGEGLFAILDHAQAHGVQVGIFTNGSLLTEATVGKLKRHPGLELLVTLHTANREEELTATLDGLRLLAEHGIFPELFVIVSKNHVPTIESALARLPQHVYRVTFRPVIPVGKAHENWDEGFAPLEAADKEAFRSLLAEMRGAFPRLTFVDSPLHPDEDGGYHGRSDGFVLHVDTDGNLLPSFSAVSERRLGSALDKSSLVARLTAEETRAYLEQADLAILERIRATQKPENPTIRLS